MSNAHDTDTNAAGTARPSPSPLPFEPSSPIAAAFDGGLAVRRKVLGDTHVDRALGNAGAFQADLQELVTAFAWGTVWTREGLPLKTRSMLTVAMLVALGKQKELEGHVRGALNNGVSVDELKEVLLHSAVYCGFPAAIEGFRTAAGVIEQYGKEVKGG
ncbi:carboxymuconolactone decarboxylase family protein [Caldimonas brevitalea]|uniref:4-carboxymuconolactone decarboxylase n=1 Tax=Caldimonas brevitalea TaxID=413882 RepID=A0A0G3BFW0_9BURK|nr:carboxymuconolactone decarboxylase family protein [Caldimonas brevitalea]AKJ28294.1 4-carboxymuconolactone decarboxylase [Caldimonas brevitalea]